MPNATWKKLMGVTQQKPVKQKINYPFTMAFVNGYCIGRADGIKSFTDFPTSDILNVIHRNGKTTVIKK